MQYESHGKFQCSRTESKKAEKKLNASLAKHSHYIKISNHRFETIKKVIEVCGGSETFTHKGRVFFNNSEGLVRVCNITIMENPFNHTWG